MSTRIKKMDTKTPEAGKSCLAFAIANLLKEYGIAYSTGSTGGCEDEHPGVMEASWRAGIATVAKTGRAVEITTRQLRLDGISSYHNDPVAAPSGAAT